MTRFLWLLIKIYVASRVLRSRRITWQYFEQFKSHVTSPEFGRVATECGFADQIPRFVQRADEMAGSIGASL